MHRTVLLLIACFAALAASSSFAEVPASPAALQIEQAERAIERGADGPHWHNKLAMALARRARETADMSYYEDSEKALKGAFKADPDNFEARKIQVWNLLGQHEFAKGLHAAKKLNERAPDDIQVYGFLADAHVELGQYAEAETAVQWMLDMRPGNVPGMTRAAYLREIHGDIDGALDLLRRAYQRIAPAEREDRAWVLTHVAHLHLSRGELDAAEQVLDEALTLFPSYHYALVKLAEVRSQQRRLDDAVDLYRKHYETAPHPENLFYLAHALEKAGQAEEAEQAYREFEKLGRIEIDNADNCNRDLVRYYADHAGRPDEALRIAKLEIERRKDILTLDALAWALHQTGDHAAALAHINQALRTGIRNAELLLHAAEIHAALGNVQQATSFRHKAISANPHSPAAQSARESLANTPRADDRDVVADL